MREEGYISWPDSELITEAKELYSNLFVTFQSCSIDYPRYSALQDVLSKRGYGCSEVAGKVRDIVFTKSGRS